MEDHIAAHHTPTKPYPIPSLLSFGCLVSQTAQCGNNYYILSRHKTGLKKVERQIAKAQLQRSCVSDRMLALIQTL